MARGMDFKGVSLVVNYDFPTSTSSVHRIGRTGRAGRAGEAVTFFTEGDVEQRDRQRDEGERLRGARLDAQAAAAAEGEAPPRGAAALEEGDPEAEDGQGRQAWRSS